MSLSFAHARPELAPLIGRPRQTASLARRGGLSRASHAHSEHPFQPAHSISKIGQLFAHPDKIGRAIANALVEQNDLAECPYGIAIEAHAAGAAFRRRPAGPSLDERAKVSATFR